MPLFCVYLIQVGLCHMNQVVKVWAGILRRAPAAALWVLDWGGHAVSNLQVMTADASSLTASPSSWGSSRLCRGITHHTSRDDAPLLCQEELRAAGLPESRLVVSKVLPIELHLARVGAADLFLDTLAYGGHTTATDALWAGE